MEKDPNFVSVPIDKAPSSVLDGQYIIGEEIGSGGFGKVKLATHILTNEKVAIKIIDKRQIGDDLPRVATELQALRTLWHQNIARLYQYTETDTHYFIVLEYCRGGELFDYIVAKDCLPEPEARHFFRQIVAALAYVHDQGFAHRDLKPENLLLTDDLQLKLIDFGLCAKPHTGLTTTLATCCGSPAYAAPELIKGREYFGNEADVWSMGILLYALLCGSLPFEDENIQTLYTKITSGRYHEPKWLSTSSKSLLRSMLQVNPSDRITVKQLLVHPWVMSNYAQPLKWRSVFDKQLVDEECVRELAIHHHATVDDMRAIVTKWEYNYTTATYFLCMNRKRRGQPLLLPPSRQPPTRYAPGTPASHMVSNVLHSPTIHASLDKAINMSGLDDSMDELEQNAMFDMRMRDGSGVESSYVRAIDDGALTDLTMATKNITLQIPPRNPPSAASNSASSLMPPPMLILPPSSTPHRQAKENRGGSVRVTRTVRNNILSNNAYGGNATGTPLRVRNTDGTSPSQAWKVATPLSKQLRGKSADSHLDGDDDLSTIPLTSITPDRQGRPTTRVSPALFATPANPMRTPGDNLKTPGTGKLGRRMFQSVERAKDSVMKMLTPRRQGREGPHNVKRTNTMVNVSTTSTDDANLVLRELLCAFERRGITCDVDGWKIRGKARQQGRQLSFDLEVVFIEHLKVVGVRRKRLNGDAFLYKRVCEDILQLACL